MYGVTCRVTKKLDRFERRAVERLLAEAGLVFEGAPDCTALAEDCDENVVATASLEGSVIKMVAASSEWREAGLSGQSPRPRRNFPRSASASSPRRKIPSSWNAARPA